MKIVCPLCNQEVAVGDIDLSQEVAKCVQCNNVFSFSDRILTPGSSSGSPWVGLIQRAVSSFRVQQPVVTGEFRERDRIIAPQGFVVRNDADGFVIIRRWLGPSVVPMAVFCLLWNGFMVVWFTIAFTQKLYQMALFGSIHGAIGLGLLYSVLASILNKTTIKVMYDSITVRHAPLPCPGGRTIPMADVRQFYSQEDIVQTKNGSSRTYAVRLLTKNEKTIDLVAGLAGRDQALFIEQQVEKFLGIRDAGVSGEISR